ncbi:MAG: ATP-binding protein [Defluviitaleaceae bacterium]|nr:ATP-binding protein [Defluviitaleaceae bacterium]
MRFKNAYRKVMREMQAERDRADALHDARRKEIYKKVPRLAEIDRELGEIGIQIARFAISGDSDAIALGREKTDALKEERLILMQKSFRGKKDLAKYNCKKCSDTGYIGIPATACVCLKQRLINEYYSLSNLREVLRDENFGTFDMQLFSEKIVENEGLSPRMNMETVFRVTNKFVKNFDAEFNNLLLFGDTGLGKTFVCHCIAKEILDRGRTVLYLTVPRLCKVIEDSRFNRISAPDEMLEAVDDVDLLVLDDLGTEISTIITSAALFDIINQRLLTRKHTVISTNLTTNELATQYSDRIVSRFLGNYQMVKFFGEDIRVKKKYGGFERRS